MQACICQLSMTIGAAILQMFCPCALFAPRELDEGSPCLPFALRSILLGAEPEEQEEDIKHLLMHPLCHGKATRTTSYSSPTPHASTTD